MKQFFIGIFQRKSVRNWGDPPFRQPRCSRLRSIFSELTPGNVLHVSFSCNYANLSFYINFGRVHRTHRFHTPTKKNIPLPSLLTKSRITSTLDGADSPVTTNGNVKDLMGKTGQINSCLSLSVWRNSIVLLLYRMHNLK